MKGILSILFCVALVTGCASATKPTIARAPVTVLYDAVYPMTSNGGKARKIETIPWADGLTLTRAIASAGGYASPPHRYIYLVRNGRTTLLPDPRQILKPEDDMQMKPGDRIEFRRSQNK